MQPSLIWGISDKAPELKIAAEDLRVFLIVYSQRKHTSSTGGRGSWSHIRNVPVPRDSPAIRCNPKSLSRCGVRRLPALKYSAARADPKRSPLHPTIHIQRWYALRDHFSGDRGSAARENAYQDVPRSTKRDSRQPENGAGSINNVTKHGRSTNTKQRPAARSKMH